MQPKSEMSTSRFTGAYLAERRRTTFRLPSSQQLELAADSTDSFVWFLSYHMKSLMINHSFSSLAQA